MLKSWRFDKTHAQDDLVDSLWKQIVNLAGDKWDDHGFIPRPYIAFEGLLAEAVRQTIPRYVLPPHEGVTEYPKDSDRKFWIFWLKFFLTFNHSKQPSIVFRLFDLEDCTEMDGAALPQSDSIIRFLVEENLFQIFMTYYRTWFNRDFSMIIWDHNYDQMTK